MPPKKPNTISLYHYLPVNCGNSDCLQYNAICLAITRTGNKRQYWLDEHPIGKCKMKEEKKKENE